MRISDWSSDVCSSDLDVPYNLFQESAEVADEPVGGGVNRRRSGAITADVVQVADWLLAAERPAFLIGHGVTLLEVGPELTALAHHLSVPVLSSPTCMGRLGMGQSRTRGVLRTSVSVCGVSGGGRVITKKHIH